ncbi:hypothetical protein EDC47_12422 [Raoultella planticola]|jgi:hypothetical protein|nr:hypothetical protein EDC47_12422 [Raoultella planticola]SMR05604.1 Uncharacterised protein [Raoultella ornithinolytica]VEC75415.1 Uncharacterised protein [Raoultella ornithinolytica]VTM69981.1 Uncharacterised protein [Raoultella planticola]VTN40181.1 Uncharacterised protein [Raoultella ornithinolytica]
MCDVEKLSISYIELKEITEMNRHGFNRHLRVI